jgi:hypothetical protein
MDAVNVLMICKFYIWVMFCRMHIHNSPSVSFPILQKWCYCCTKMHRVSLLRFVKVPYITTSTPTDCSEIPDVDLKTHANFTNVLAMRQVRRYLG